MRSVEIDEAPRSHGQSNYDLVKLVKVALRAMTNYTTIPLRFASILGFVFTIIGIFVLLYVLTIYFTLGSIPGFTFLASVLAIFSGVQLFALGIIGEYLATALRAEFRAPTLRHPSPGWGRYLIAVILQPSYIPWRGYFDQIRRADTFIFYDDVQYDKHGWRNRNQIKTAGGKKWLTIPVHSAGVTGGIPIKDVQIDWSKPWPETHLQVARGVPIRGPRSSRSTCRFWRNSTGGATRRLPT